MRLSLVLIAMLVSTNAAAQASTTTSLEVERLRTDWASLRRYRDDNARLGPPAPGEQRVVFMGNSITESWQTLDSGFFAGRSYVNRGISGQTTPQMLVRFRQDVIDLHPAAVVLLGGINDIAENTGPTTLEAIFGNIVSMAELAKASGITVVLCSVLPASDFAWRHGLDPGPKVAALNAMIRHYADANHIVYVDYYPAMVDGRGGLRSELTTDGVHPNLAGYHVMEPIAQRGIQAALASAPHVGQ
ncbi:MAG TPA: SGNH/GDSL hydrolase family protein [Gemmatimonadaceae bacterium]|nr:SGNH/GDSL hydrolase family protein [Gemmatimonadaceae bacterium]